MKVKSHKELIDGHNTVTFFIEDVSTNTLIHSDTFIINRKTRIKALKAGFVEYVLDMQKMELALLNAEVHKIKVNSNNSNNNIN
jgi:C4-type Zn-finger protein